VEPDRFAAEQAIRSLFEVAASKEAAFFLRVAKDEIHGSDPKLLPTLSRIATRERGIGTVAGGRHGKINCGCRVRLARARGCGWADPD